MEGGRILIRDTLEVVGGLRCTEAERAAMYLGNAQTLLRL